MNIKSSIRRILEKTGYTVSRLPQNGASLYDQDGLRTSHNHDFMKDPSFQKAYKRGCKAASDYHWHWRVHIGLWAASTASKLAGDFVECGVNRGFLSSAIMEYLDWDSLNRTFYLLDTFQGLDPRYASGTDGAHSLTQSNSTDSKGNFYVRGPDSVRANFSEWNNIRIIEGSVPDTLPQVDSQNIAYLHLDMNCANAEVAALEFLWSRMLPGAVVLMDDYAYSGYESQKPAMDPFAHRKEVTIASLPTGQGLLIKPPHN